MPDNVIRFARQKSPFSVIGIVLGGLLTCASVPFMVYMVTTAFTAVAIDCPGDNRTGDCAEFGTSWASAPIALFLGGLAILTASLIPRVHPAIRWSVIGLLLVIAGWVTYDQLSLVYRINGTW